MRTFAVSALAVVLFGLFVACVGEGPERVVSNPPIIAPDSAIPADGAQEPAENDASPAEDNDAGEICTAPDYNLAGCVCATKGAAIPCYQGVPGPKSACSMPGVQRCEENGSTLRWSACDGGTKPKTADACHDDIDDDCDGKVDQNCACSPDIDLCRPAAISSADAGAAPTHDPNAYTMFTLPSQPKAGVPFDLYIVTKNRTLVSPGLLKNGAICYGGGLSKACPSPGAGCGGWKVGFFKGVTENLGTYSFSIKDPQGPTGCEGATIATLSVVVN